MSILVTVYCRENPQFARDVCECLEEMDWLSTELQACYLDHELQYAGKSLFDEGLMTSILRSIMPIREADTIINTINLATEREITNHLDSGDTLLFVSEYVYGPSSIMTERGRSEIMPYSMQLPEPDITIFIRSNDHEFIKTLIDKYTDIQNAKALFITSNIIKEENKSDVVATAEYLYACILRHILFNLMDKRSKTSKQSVSDGDN